MLEIESEKGFLELDESVVVDFESSYNLYDLRVADETFSWRFKLMKSPKNWQTLNWMWLPESSLVNQSINVRILIFGQVWKTGPLYFLQEDDDNWDVSFTGESGGILQKMSGKSLKDISWPQTSVVDIYSHAEDTVDDPIGTHDYVFAPVDLPQLGQVEWYPAQINSVVVDSNGDFDQYPQYWRTFEVDEYSPTRVAVPNTTIGYLSGEYVRFAGKYYIANQNVTIGSSNDPSNNPSVWDETTLGNVFQYNPMVPFFYVVNLLELIADDLGFELKGNVLQDEEIRRLVLFNTQCLNGFVGDQLNIVPANVEIDYSRHLPDMGVIDLIKEFALFFNLQVSIEDNGNTLVFNKRNNFLLRSPQTILRHQTLKMYQQFRETRGYNLSQDYLDDDLVLAHDTWTGTLEGLIFSGNNTDVRLKFSTLPMTTGFGTVDLSNEWFPGDMWRPISSLELNDTVPRQFLFFRGKHRYENGPVSWSNDPEIPIVTSDLSYTPVVGGLDQYSLLVQGSGGIYQTWWKPIMDSLNSLRVFKAYVLIKSDQFGQLNFRQRQALWQYVGLIEKMKLSIGPATREIIAEVQFVGR